MLRCARWSADVLGVPRPRISRHALPATLVAAASLAMPFVATADPGVAGAAASVTARAAQHVEEPAPARFAVGGPLFQSAQRIAGEHWGGVAACGGDVAVTWAALAPGTNATATWRNPTDAWNNAVANFDCSIELNANAEFDFAKLCTVLAHEVGHLVGRPHAAHAGDLMSPIYSTPLPACVAAAPPGPPDVADEPAEAATSPAVLQTASRASSPRKASAKRKKRSVRWSLRKAGSAKRCVRRFAAGRRAAKVRCARVARHTKRGPVRVKRQSPA